MSQLLTRYVSSKLVGGKSILAEEITRVKAWRQRICQDTFEELGVGCKGQGERDPQGGPTGCNLDCRGPCRPHL